MKIKRFQAIALACALMLVPSAANAGQWQIAHNTVGFSWGWCTVHGVPARAWIPCWAG